MNLVLFFYDNSRLSRLRRPTLELSVNETYIVMKQFYETKRIIDDNPITTKLLDQTFDAYNLKFECFALFHRSQSSIHPPLHPQFPFIAPPGPYWEWSVLGITYHLSRPAPPSPPAPFTPFHYVL